MKKLFQINYLHFVLIVVFLGLGIMPNRAVCQTDRKETAKRLQELVNRLKSQRGTYDYASASTPPVHEYSSPVGTYMNHYNGVFTTSIDFGDGITISNGNSGISVNQIASWIGLGWNLNVGGKITRIVRGYPDDLRETVSVDDGNLHNYLFNGWLMNPIDDNDRPSDIIEQFDFEQDLNHVTEDLDLFIGNQGHQVSSYIYKYYKYDSEPDLFQFSYPGNSGTFVFGHDDCPGTTNCKNAEFIPYQNLKVEYTITFQNNKEQISSITITDEYGIKYVFSEYEEVITNTGIYPTTQRLPLDYGYPDFVSGTFSGFSNYESGYIQSWLLKKIIYPNFQEIVFDYDDEEISLEEYFYQNYRDYTETGPNEPILDMVRNYPSFDNYADPIVKTKRLKSISGDEFEIELIANTIREDLFVRSEILNANKPRALDKIRVYSKIEDIKTLVKQIDFTYSYFSSNCTYCEPNLEYAIYERDQTNPYGDYITKRLKLEEIQIYNGNELLPPYKFDYISEIEENWLPARYSYCQDFWGYFKYNSTETSLVPKVYCYPNRDGQYRFSVYQLDGQTPGATNKYTLEGADRMPDGDYIDNGMLKRINYPTGGYTEFTYEPNDFIIDEINDNTFIGAGVRVSQIDSDGPGTTKSQTTYTYENDAGESSGKLISMPLFGHLDPTNATCEDFLGATYSQWDKEDFNFYYIRGTENENDMMEGTMGYDRVEEVVLGTEGMTVYHFENSATYNDYDDIDYESYKTVESEIVPSRNDYLQVGLYEEANPGDTYDIPYDLDGIDTQNGSSPFATNTNYSWHRGKLIKKEIVNDNDLVVSSAETDFDFHYGKDDGPTIVYGLKNTFLRNNVPPIGSNCELYNNDTAYVYLFEPLTVSSKYEIHTNVNSLPSSFTSTYASDSQSDISEIKNYEYNDQGLIKKETYTDANGDKIITENKYICDLWPLNSPLPDENDIENNETKVIINLISKHNSNSLVQSTTYKIENGQTETVVVSSSLLLFKIFDAAQPGNTLELPFKRYVMVSDQQLEANDISNLTIIENENYKYELEYDLTHYELVQEYTKYDSKGNLIEVVPENRQPSTSLYSTDNYLLVGNAANSIKGEFAYTGFEFDKLDGWSTSGNTSFASSYVKSGMQNLDIGQNGKIYNSIEITNDPTINGYKAMIWAKGATTGYLSVSVNGSLTKTQSLAQTSDWELLYIEITRQELQQFSSSQLLTFIVEAGNTSSSSFSVDDIRFFPSDAAISTYTYDLAGLLTSICDQNGRYVYFDYDDFGRHTLTRDHDKNILEKVETFTGNPCDFSFYPADLEDVIVKKDESIKFVRNLKNGVQATFMFGDGSANEVTTANSVQHTFTTADTFEVTLEMAVEGLNYSISRTVTVVE